jgi:hypothetical protein
MNIPKLRSDFERRYGWPLKLSDDAIRRLVEWALASRAALPAPEPEPEERRPLPAHFDDQEAPRVRWSNETLERARAKEHFPESTRRRILAMKGGVGPVHVSTGLLSELDPGAHLVPSSDGQPTYAHHEPER